MIGLLLAVFVAGTPFAAHAAGSWSHAVSAREARAQQIAIRPVRATLLQTAPDWTFTDYATIPETEARWTAPDGHVRTGLVIAESGDPAGSTIVVWVNRAGQLTDPPLQPAVIAGRDELAEGLSVLVLAVVLLVAGCLACRLLDRRRMAAWDADWLANGPRWSPRR